VLAVRPLGFERVAPRVLGRQLARDDPHPGAARLDLSADLGGVAGDEDPVAASGAALPEGRLHEAGDERLRIRRSVPRREDPQNGSSLLQSEHVFRLGIGLSVGVGPGAADTPLDQIAVNDARRPHKSRYVACARLYIETQRRPWPRPLRPIIQASDVPVRAFGLKRKLRQMS
jgi:hypothetical protein